MTKESLLIGAAVFMLAFGAFVTVLERIRRPPATPVITFTGIAGVYLGLSATVEHIRWLYLCLFCCSVSRRLNFVLSGDLAVTTITAGPAARPSLTQESQSRSAA